MKEEDIMQAKKWIIIGAAGTLGLGIIAGGAAAMADSLDLRDVSDVSTVQPVEGTSTDGGVGNTVSGTDSPVSTPSPATPVSSQSAMSTPSAVTPPSAQSPATTASVTSADSPS
jgi:hypothetical protein